ncbi:MAG: DUF805 domain-containing protein [Hyphomicrobiales bacterium]
MDWGALFFSFSGRINRAKYWAAAVILMLAFMVPFMIAVSTMSSVVWVLAGVVFVAVTICGIAVGAKRLHDRDKSAWWLVLFYLGPAFLSVLGDAAGGAGVIFHVVGFGISIWALVELGFLRGTAGPNRFGPDPLATTGAQPGAHPVS